MTFNDLLGTSYLFFLNLPLINYSMFRNFHQNWFINKFAKMKKAEILESQNSESRRVFKKT